VHTLLRLPSITGIANNSGLNQRQPLDIDKMQCRGGQTASRQAALEEIGHQVFFSLQGTT
jgi:hypothetical protein